MMMTALLWLDQAEVYREALERAGLGDRLDL